MLLNTTQTSLIDLSRKTDGSQDTAAFANDVHTGLSQLPKSLPSRYFYDAEGSRLFQQIMELPEYYLTRSEYSLINSQKSGMASAFAKGGFFHLIDLGAGDALKTKLLLHELQKQHCSFDYVPIDISGSAMQELTEKLHTEMPDLDAQAVVGEYIQALQWLQANKTERKVVLFLGSNIGNFEREDSLEFLKQIRACLSPGDLLLLGVDLRKDPDTILAAYRDEAGVTSAFNLNLLNRINRELGGDFVVANFQHFALYDPQGGVMKSFLVSQQDQTVYLEATGQRYTFSAWEAVHTENSHKYTIDLVQEMADQCGFETAQVYQDEQGLFADVLLKVH
ncbi:L-histidine N(alpha)-methyltransferase [uncultured Pontibacter sp.]|uniref:L-histidine N(alpha)-methyltransferase n=1 Tax=uncultured Pontibacter sp. TaxID=453356 RepID=UPI0026260A64|nr:L-histidine N(alpha)-methyltransferase [uncultured Pontibacter sp.]